MLLTSPVAFLEETVKSSIWFCNCNSYSCFSLFDFQLKVIKFQNRERQNWDESKQNVQPFSFTGEETLKCEIVFCKRMSHLMLYVPHTTCVKSVAQYQGHSFKAGIINTKMSHTAYITHSCQNYGYRKAPYFLPMFSFLGLSFGQSMEQDQGTA